MSIKRSDDKELILDLCKQNKKVYSPAYYAYVAIDNNKLASVALFEIKSNEVEVINYISSLPNDESIFDGVLRAGFKYANENNIETGVISEEFREKFILLFEKLNFTNESSFDINNFFNKYKNCKL